MVTTSFAAPMASQAHAVSAEGAKVTVRVNESRENGRLAVERALGYVKVSQVGGRQGDALLSPDSGVGVELDGA